METGGSRLRWCGVCVKTRLVIHVAVSVALPVRSFPLAACMGGTCPQPQHAATALRHFSTAILANGAINTCLCSLSRCGLSLWGRRRYRENTSSESDWSMTDTAGQDPWGRPHYRGSISSGIWLHKTSTAVLLPEETHHHRNNTWTASLQPALPALQPQGSSQPQSNQPEAPRPERRHNN